MSSPFLAPGGGAVLGGSQKRDPHHTKRGRSRIPGKEDEELLYAKRRVQATLATTSIHGVPEGEKRAAS
jgi:hypothetical protein